LGGEIETTWRDIRFGVFDPKTQANNDQLYGNGITENEG
jgi:hypothetical protein